MTMLNMIDEVTGGDVASPTVEEPQRPFVASTEGVISQADPGESGSDAADRLAKEKRREDKKAAIKEKFLTYFEEGEKREDVVAEFDRHFSVVEKADSTPVEILDAAKELGIIGDVVDYFRDDPNKLKEISKQIVIDICDMDINDVQSDEDLDDDEKTTMVASLESNKEKFLEFLNRDIRPDNVEERAELAANLYPPEAPDDSVIAALKNLGYIEGDDFFELVKTKRNLHREAKGEGQPSQPEQLTPVDQAELDAGLAQLREANATLADPTASKQEKDRAKTVAKNALKMLGKGMYETYYWWGRVSLFLLSILGGGSWSSCHPRASLLLHARVRRKEIKRQA